MRNYYIIGSKHGAGKGKWNNIFPFMREAKAVDVGYARDLDLTAFYGKPESEIYAYLKKNDPDPRAANSHKLFLNIRPGDFIAVKEYAAPKGKVPRLKIRGYAVVKARASGGAYRYYKGHRLPHQISVEFQPHKERTFQIGGYGGTISRLGDPKAIEEIFAPMLGKLSTLERAELHDIPSARRKEAVLSDVEGYAYHVDKTINVSLEHKKLQKRLRERLEHEYGADCVRVERDWVDIEVTTGKTLVLYEIKPFKSAALCLRAALGQIMLYAWRKGVLPGIKLKLVIAGPCEMTKGETDFLRYLQKHFGKELEYCAVK